MINCGIPILVVCRSEEVSSLSTSSALAVTVDLIFWGVDQNLFLSLPEFVFVTNNCAEFSLEAMSEQ